MSRYICFTKLKHLIFMNGGSSCYYLHLMVITSSVEHSYMHTVEYRLIASAVHFRTIHVLITCYAVTVYTTKVNTLEMQLKF
jgi:hypothetical protein